MATDIYNPELYLQGTPHAVFRSLRAQGDVYRQELPEGRGYWALLRHADVVAVSKDPATYSSQRMATLIEDPTPENLPLVRTSMVNMDPPAHDRYRKLVLHALTRRRVAELEPEVRGLAAQVLSRMEPGQHLDFASDIAAQVPVLVMARLLGAPAEDAPQLLDWGRRLIDARNPDDQLAASIAMAQYGQAIADDRRKRPREDLISALALAEVDGERLDADGFGGLFVQLTSAGNETTRSLLCLGLDLFMKHPEQWQRLVANVEAWPAALEEVLRHEPPLHYMRRTTTREVQIGGRTIPEGERIVMLYTAANRDEAVFADPDRFDVARTPNHHLSFGIGEHFCLGAALARLEARVFFELFSERFALPERTADFQRIPSNLVNGFVRMPVRLIAR